MNIFFYLLLFLDKACQSLLLFILNSIFLHLFSFLAIFYHKSLGSSSYNSEELDILKMIRKTHSVRLKLMFSLSWGSLIKYISCFINWATRSHWFGEAHIKTVNSPLILFLELFQSHICYCFFSLIFQTNNIKTIFYSCASLLWNENPNESW